ncbi:hypothetical protein V6N11_033391 [Hibiscus sabdariffa]|uniref:Uncharacterized protein n=1 Tax=Hibiscus sabdariffa TaxID=183260 RepID=A0ABR2PXW5_9ROSI
MILEFYVGFDEPRNQNKKRMQDENLLNRGDGSPLVTVLKPGYEEPYDDEDIELVEGSVIRGMEGGVITIDFSNRVHELAIKSLECTIVIKMLG